MTHAKWFKFLLIFISWVLLLLPSILNGFPFVHPDTGTYLASGFKLEVPIDRPIFYGLFIRHVSLSDSLWFVVGAQSIIIVYVIRKFLTLWISDSNWILTSCVILLLSLTTFISNFVSLIHPDVFTGIQLLLFFVLLHAQLKSRQTIFLTCLFVFSSIVHLSHLALLLSYFLILSLALLKRLVSLKKFAVLVSILVAPFIVTLITNKTLTNAFNISNSGSVFTFARLIDTGLLESFYTENCAENNYIFCDSNKTLATNSIAFLWNYETSPLYANGCIEDGWESCWRSQNEGMKRVIHEVITIPKYRNQLIAILIKDCIKQLYTFDFEALMANGEGTPTRHWVKRKLEGDLMLYDRAEQQNGYLIFGFKNKLQLITVLISLILLLYLFIRFNKQFHVLKFTISCVIITLITNACIVSFFSGVVCRYQCRIIWVLPLLAFIMLILGVRKFKDLQTKPSSTKK